MQIADPEYQLPNWLWPTTKLSMSRMIQLMNTKPAAFSGQQSAQPATELPQPDFGVFPSTLQELVGNEYN